MRYKYLSTLMFFNFVLCMEQPATDNNVSFGLSIALRHGIEIFDHPTICSSAINKECEKALRETADLRKKYFIKHQSKEIFHEITWHKYGSAQGIMAFDSKTLYASFFSLTERSHGWSPLRLDHWADNHCKPIAGLEKAQFDSTGQLFFYAIKKEPFMLWGETKHIIQYTFLPNGKTCRQRCGISLGKGLCKHFALSYLLPFQALLKALLKSTVDIEYDISKSYSLQEAVIPHNYKDCNSSDECCSFEDLPDELKIAIDAAYAKQCSKSK